VPVKTADMTPYLIKVKDYKPDVIFVGSWGGDAINALKAAYEMGLHKKFKIFHFWLANVFAVGIPPQAIKGVWSQMFWYWNMKGFKNAVVVKASNRFSRKYIAAYGHPPDPYAMAAYSGVMEAARAIKLAGSTDPRKMYAALMKHPGWSGPKGPARWRRDGRPVYKYSTYIVEGKGPGQRAGKFPKYDYARIVDAYAGAAFLPPLKALGY
jgi:branched-chain amino acid transport system substrate-binding protein